MEETAARLRLPGWEIAPSARPGTFLEVVLNRNRSVWRRAEVPVRVCLGLIRPAIRASGQPAAEPADTDAT